VRWNWCSMIDNGLVLFVSARHGRACAGHPRLVRFNV
jgi:hypothetical protein